MIYKFKSKAGSDVIMLSAHGDQMLTLLGRAPSAKGLVDVPDLAAAISALERAVAADEANFAQAVADAKAVNQPAPRRTGISLHQRAWPLIELLRRSQKAGQPLLWGV
ncbi:DUF1840 domain-containing protein [Roseateles sp. GG27B]